MKFYNLKVNNFLIIGFLITSLAGFSDALFLTIKYYIGTINCSLLSGCQEVLNSAYSNIFGIPVALFGIIFYLVILFSSLLYIQHKNKIAINILAYLPTLGLLFSIFLIYLQIFIIKSICIYCLGSALSSTIFFVMSVFVLKTNTTNKINLN